jgi:hypothetical protein
MLVLLTQYAIGVIANGMKSIPNFMKILAEIIKLNAHKRITQVTVVTSG